MTESFLETLTGKKVNQDPVYKRRRRLGAAAILASAVAAGAGYNYLADHVSHVAPNLKQESPAQIYGNSYKEYIVQPGDSVDGITEKAYPHVEVGGLAFNQAAHKIDEQLPVADQTMGRVYPGEHIALAKNAKIGTTENKAGNKSGGVG